MIRVDIDTRNGRLANFAVTGHDKPAAGSESLVCGIVSMLARTAARLVEENGEISWHGSAEKPGELKLTVTDCPAELEGWLQGLTDFVLKGFRDVQADYPDAVSLHIKEKLGDRKHGT